MKGQQAKKAKTIEKDSVKQQQKRNQNKNQKQKHKHVQKAVDIKDEEEEDQEGVIEDDNDQDNDQDNNQNNDPIPDVEKKFTISEYAIKEQNDENALEGVDDASLVESQRHVDKQLSN